MLDHLARSRRNYFSDVAMNRLSWRRTDPQWVQAKLTDPHTRVAPLWRFCPLLIDEDRGSFNSVWHSWSAFGDHECLAAEVVFLGERDEVAHFSVSVSDERTARRLQGAGEYHELREVGALLDAGEGAMLAYARAMAYWHWRHRFCGVCGAPTVSDEAGHLRVCGAAQCGEKHFPRTDPAVIVLVIHVDDGQERCLLGRQASWSSRVYSALAGFVEPGETLEGAVLREVAEEAGVEVREVHYHSSQPWPFPSSLMLGFTAMTQDTRIVRHDQELQDARWFSRHELQAALLSHQLRVPRAVSIAYRLLEDWYDRAQGAGAFGELVERVGT